MSDSEVRHVCERHDEGGVGLCVSPVAAETILAMPPPSEWPVLHTREDAGCGSEVPRARACVERPCLGDVCVIR